MYGVVLPSSCARSTDVETHSRGITKQRQHPAMMLSPASMESEESETRPFCTCSDWPASVKDAEPLTVAAAFEPTSPPRPYCTCQTAQLPDATAQAEPTSPPRPFCTCRSEPLPELDTATLEEPPSDEATHDTADDVEAEVEAAAIVVELETQPIAEPQDAPVDADRGETDLAKLETHDGEFTLTDRRVIMQGNNEARTVWASMSIYDVQGARIDRTLRGNRGWIWTAIGAAATIAIWQILDGGGWIRLAFPGLVALSTVVMLFTTMLAPLPLIFSVIGRDGNRIDSRITSDELEAAEAFSRKLMNVAQAAAARANDSEGAREDSSADTQ